MGTEACRLKILFPSGLPGRPIRLPDDKHARLKVLAGANSININKLTDELATVALANHAARVRFETRAARGNPKRALALLDTATTTERPA